MLFGDALVSGRCVSGRAGETLFGDALASGLCVSGRAGGTLFRDALASGRLSLAGQGGRCLEMHWACLGSHLGRLSRHSGHDPEGKQTHVGGSEGIQPSGALLRAASPPREEVGHQFPARVGPAPSPSFGVRMLIGGEVRGVPCRHDREEASWSSALQFLCSQGGAEGP